MMASMAAAPGVLGVAIFFPTSAIHPPIPGVIFCIEWLFRD